MRPVKVTILGKFWDSQIYAGELLLFDEHGAMRRINWREAIDDLATQNEAMQTALRVAFLDGDLFYNPKVRKILLDPELVEPIKNQLSTLAVSDLQADLMHDWGRYCSMQDSPFRFLPTDTEVYYNTIFAAGNEGLYSAPRQGAAKLNRQGYFNRHHDGGVFQVKASDKYTSLATASGDDGLMEFPLEKDDYEYRVGQQKILANRACSACDWAFQSVMGWTASSAFMASFKEEKAPQGAGRIRLFDRVMDLGDDVFSIQSATRSNGRAIAWGAREKMYYLTSAGLEVADYNPDPSKRSRKKSEYSMFDRRGAISESIDVNEVVATGTAPFGTVIELNDELLIIRSDGHTERFQGEPLHWRVFPRSEHYSNQLHILYDDRVEIISFVHDYFVSQSDKLSGFMKGVDDALSRKSTSLWQ